MKMNENGKLTTYNIEWDGLITNVNAKTFNGELSYCYENGFDMNVIELKNQIITEVSKNGELVYRFIHKIK